MRDRANRTIAEGKAELAAHAAEQQAAHNAKPEVIAAVALRAEQDTRRGTFTRDTLAGVTSVHTKRGWHIVCKLNAKSVTVRTWDGTSTIPYAQIDDTRTQVAA